MIDIQEAQDTVVRMWYKASEQHVQGNMTRAVEGWAAAMNYQRQMAKEAGFSTNTRYLPDVGWTVGIGHMATLDIFSKMKILGMARTDYVVVADNIVNQTYLDLFRPYLTILPKSTFTEDIRLTEDYLAVIEIDGCWTWFIDALAIVQQRWEAEGRSSLLKLSQEQIEAGRQKLGLKPDDWFVTLHIRKANNVHNLRDIDYEAWDEAIKRIETVGGKVVQVPSEDRALDIFLLSQARFVIVGNSGPAWVAGTFGTPALLANWCPMGIKFPYKGATFLHKKLWHKDKSRFFTPEEYCEPFNHIVSKEVLAQHNIASIPNTSEEILDGVEHMLRETVNESFVTRSPNDIH